MAPKTKVKESLWSDSNIYWFCSVVAFFLWLATIPLTRVDRAVGLIQEDTTAILNDLTEIQTQEKNLQAAFEADLGQNDLALFKQKW